MKPWYYVGRDTVEPDLIDAQWLTRPSTYEEASLVVPQHLCLTDFISRRQNSNCWQFHGKLTYVPLSAHLTPVISRELKLGCVPRLVDSHVATKWLLTIQETLVLSPYSARAPNLRNVRGRECLVGMFVEVVPGKAHVQ